MVPLKNIILILRKTKKLPLFAKRVLKEVNVIKNDLNGLSASQINMFSLIAWVVIF